MAVSCPLARGFLKFKARLGRQILGSNLEDVSGETALKFANFSAASTRSRIGKILFSAQLGETRRSYVNFVKKQI